MFSSIVGAFLLTFASLFPIVNPFESAPFFLVMTQGQTSEARRALARHVAVNGFVLLLGSMTLGPWLLEFFGIQTPVVRIAGGLVVTALGWKLLTQEQWSDHSATSIPRQDSPAAGSFYPLTMPLTVGPGSISVAVAIGSRQPPGSLVGSQTALHAIGALVGLLCIAVTIYIAYRFAERIARVLGATGIDVMVRLSAFIMMCIGIQFVWTGYSTLAGAVAH